MSDETVRDETVRDETVATIEFDDLPVEVVYSILELLDHKEKFALQSVCTLWKELFNHILLVESPFDISKTLQLNLAIDSNYRGHPEYAWFIKQITGTENLCVKVGWKILEIDMLEQEVEDSSNNELLTKLQISEKAFEQAIDNKLTRKLLTTLHARYVENCLKKFEDLYSIKLTAAEIGADTQHMPILLIAGGSDPRDIYVEFTLNDPETFHPHDYKMSCEVDEDTGVVKWNGLGDYWESMEILDILKLFWDESKSAYNFTCNNIETSSISYIFEFIVYATSKN
jgi:hypothetical protein